MTGRELCEKFTELNGDRPRALDNPRSVWQNIPLHEQLAWEDLATWVSTQLPEPSEARQ